MATKSENAEIAVLQQQMTDTNSILREVRDDIKNIKDAISVDRNSFVRKGELKTFKYVTVPLVILASAIITALVYFYISNRHSLALPDVQTTTVTTPSGGASGTSTSTTSSTPSQSTPSAGVQVNLPKVTP